MQSIDDLLSTSGLGDGVVGKLNGDHDEGNVLRGVGFGGGHTDLWAGLSNVSGSPSRLPFGLR